MKTTHRVFLEDARRLNHRFPYSDSGTDENSEYTLEEDSVDLVVTSPPYPMVEMWDDVFTEMSDRMPNEMTPEEAPFEAFAEMHRCLQTVWQSLKRIVRPGGIVCVNIGAATRKLDGEFQCFPNPARIIEYFQNHGFTVLPDILWRKPTNKANKFMGSGMIPTNAYPTMERERILVFRNGGTRDFPAKDETRYASAYFWEERNTWFSDMWTDIRGESQDASEAIDRDRTAAFPLEIPYRLISMFSVQGDTVLDPFWGTGTTSVAAALTGRNSVGFELDEGMVGAFRERLSGLPERSSERLRMRLDSHHEYATSNQTPDFGYQATHYDTPVKTKQEKDIRFQTVSSIANDRLPDGEEHDIGELTVEHTEYEWSPRT